MKLISLLFVTIIIVIVCLSCDDRSPSSEIPDILRTPMENEEAELAAMTLSGELVAPTYLYRKIKGELELIRSTWIDSIPDVGVEYKPNIFPSTLVILLYEGAFDSLLSGDYHEWDSLNNYYRLDTIDIMGFKEYLTLRFKGRLNPRVIYYDYNELEGVRGVTGHDRVVESSLLLINNAEYKFKYFFKYCSNIMDDCMSSNFHYFEIEDGQAVHKGSWYRKYPPPEEGWDPPAWMDIYQETYNNYYYLTEY